MADRYTGRHTRQARHGAWQTKKRAVRGRQQLLPAAAAVTVAGMLVGSAGTVIHLSASERDAAETQASIDAANFPPADHSALTDAAALTDRPALAGATDANAAKAGAANSPKPVHATVVASGSCIASYYNGVKLTSGGQTTTLTAANKTLPYGTEVKVTNEANGESVIVKINDRGPFVQGRCLDLSKDAFGQIADLGAGVVDVHYEVLAQDAT